jgi:ELWxxDGT repeat protein
MNKILLLLTLVILSFSQMEAQEGSFRLVADIIPGTSGSNPTNFKVLEGRLVFVAEKEDGKGALFAFDGDQLSEILSFDISITLGSTIRFFKDGLAEINGRRLFILETQARDILMVTDGTSAGTLELKDISQGQIFNISNFFYLNNKLYFLEDGNDVSLWETDGTADGTKEVKVFCNQPPPDCYVQASLSAFPAGNKVFFFLATPGTGREVWVTDGTAPGTQVIDILAGPETGSWLPFVDGAAIEDDFYFGIDDGIHGYELYRTDGTLQGTALVKDINKTVGNGYHNRNSRPYQFYAYNNKVLFTADDGIYGEEVWVTDGSPEGTKMLVETQPGITERGDFNYYRPFGGQLLFQASKNNVVSSYDIWKTDGTPEGTQMLKSMSYNFNAFVPQIEFRGKLLFLAKTMPGGTQLWTTDGTTAGTSEIARLSSINNLSVSSSARFSALGDFFYFIADDGSGGRIWQSGGEQENTRPLPYTGVEVTGPVNIDHFVSLKDKLYFSASFDGKGFELWEYAPALVSSVLSNMKELPTVSCFPNPSNGTIQYRMTEQPDDISISDIAGRAQRTTITGNTFRTDHLPAGVYQIIFYRNEIPVGQSRITVQ